MAGTVAKSGVGGDLEGGLVQEGVIAAGGAASNAFAPIQFLLLGGDRVDCPRVVAGRCTRHR